MVSFRSLNRAVTVNAIIALVTFQFGIRGLVLWSNESGGDTYDVIGDINGPRYLWMLIPEGWTLDLIARFSFWFLLPLSIVFLARAVIAARHGERQHVVAPHLSAAVLLLFAAWTFLIGCWGLLVVLTRGAAIDWSPPEIVFPSILYLVIHRIWPVFMLVAGVLGYMAWRVRQRAVLPM